MNTDRIFQSGQNGVYICPSLRDDLDILRTHALSKKIKCYSINALFIPNRSGLFRALHEVAELPDYFGHNFDALEECLLDYSFAPASGYLFAFTHSKILRDMLGEEYAVLTAVFENAAANWQKEGVFFKLLTDE
ncbi:barstar family protein [Pseudoflavitalea sp. G-6-1-2]|uniref:barstar family protein n=1 Tax=Pseudoflavitalea sp. G-6-1-2 TaxID=2728841 RepID=UPI00146B5748|nr:barstar family protein [Pseudoflavitalea sp. G-6-1-2]NML22674.1 barstar family protein [Pseudoflavitalea sp. G-6-1-2]